MEHLDRPRATSSRLSTTISALLNDRHCTEHELVVTDWRELVRTRFDLSHAQVAALDGIPAEQSGVVQAALAAAAVHGGQVDVRLAFDTEGSERGALTVVANNPPSPPTADGTVAQRFSIGIAHGTFDADCGNWQCGWGPG